jgi:putative transposase
MLVKRLADHHKVSTHQACEAMMLTRSVRYYKSVRTIDVAVRRRIVEIANTRIRYGVTRIHALLKRKGWKVNKKRIHLVFTRKKGLTFAVKDLVEAK